MAVREPPCDAGNVGKEDGYSPPSPGTNKTHGAGGPALQFPARAASHAVSFWSSTYNDQLALIVPEIEWRLQL
jgi:hypothetical protein